MSLRIFRTGAAAILLIVLASQFALGLSLHRVGLRFLLPWTDVPFVLGVEASVDADFGAVGSSFFLTPDGRTLLLGTVDIQVGDPAATAQSYFRLTGGLLYLNTAQSLPQLVAGGGLVVETSLIGAVTGGMSAEFIYPFAFPLPMFSLMGAWSIP